MKKLVCMMIVVLTGCASATMPANAPSATPPKSPEMVYDVSGSNKTAAHAKAYYLCMGKFTITKPTREVKDNDYHIFVTCDDP